MNSLNDPLLRPMHIGNLQLPTSIALAPMTRRKATKDGVPTESMIEYYSDRAENGLTIAESTWIGPLANAYPNTPGICSEEQIGGWRQVAVAVHKKKGVIFLQLWHAGMMSHKSYRRTQEQPYGILPLSPSGVAPLRKRVPLTELDYEKPKSMRLEHLEKVKSEFVSAAVNAVTKAGMDGVELHAASGYLLDTFLHHSTNLRSDSYGGSFENSCRYVLEIVDAVILALKDSRKVAIRISPVPLPSMGDNGKSNISECPDDANIYEYLLKQLDKRNLAYVHLSSDNEQSDCGLLGIRVSQFARKHFQGILIGGGSKSLDEARKDLANGTLNLVYFGRRAIANPDLRKMLEEGRGEEEFLAFDRNMIDSPPRSKYSDK